MIRERGQATHPLTVTAASSPAALMLRGFLLSTSSDRREVTTPDDRRVASITRPNRGPLGRFSDHTHVIGIGELRPPLRTLVLAAAVTAFDPRLRPRGGGGA